jgi:addiction module HigA family antidote
MAKTKIQSPGAVLNSFMDEYQINPFKLAGEIKLSNSSLRQILLGKTRISASAALRFAKYFANDPEYWLNLQIQYDLLQAAKDKELTQILKGIKKAKKSSGAKSPSAPKTGSKVSKPKTAKEKTAVSANRAVKDKSAKTKKAVKVSEQKKRGRKPKTNPVIESPQEKTFVPHVELIKKKKDPVLSVPSNED